MNEDYYPLITLIFLLPLVFSPYSIEGLFAEDMENQAIIQFEYPRSLTDLKTDLQIQLQPELNHIHNTIDSTNYSSLTLIEADDYLEYQEAIQILQVNLQEVFALKENLIDVEYSNPEINGMNNQ